MRPRADGDDAAGAVGRQRVAQAEREREVAEVIRGELQLPALRRARLGARHDARVVDEDVQRPGPGRDERRDRGAICEVEVLDVHVGIAGRVGDLSGRALAGGEVAHRERHVGSGAGQRTRRLYPDPRCAARHDDAAAREVDAARHLRRRRVVPVIRADGRHPEPLAVG